MRTYGKYTGLSSMVMFGGVGMQPQIDKLRRGVDILVATPGRLLDHNTQGTIDLSGVEILVLDEADRMLDMGFISDIKKILAVLPKKRQNLLFSATFSGEIKRLASSYLQDPVTIEVARSNATASTIEQRFYRVDEDDKRQAFELTRQAIGYRMLQLLALPLDSMDRASLHTALLDIGRS